MLSVNPGGLVRQAGALQAAHGCHPHAAAQERILAIGLFGAAPAWFACQVQHRREGMVLAAHAHLTRNGSEDFLHQVRVPGAGQPNRLRIRSAAIRHQPMQGLVNEKSRNAQAGVLAQVSLDGIGGECGIPGAQVLARASQSADTIGQACPGGLIELHAFIRQHVGLHVKDGHLGDLLFQGHAGQQVSHTLRNRQSWVAIRSFSHFCYFPSKRSFATKFIQAKSLPPSIKTRIPMVKTDNLL